ncbi:MAG: hypothetical protein KatS3mg019_0919 [Fimbriimonadales bacterium]|nr:MAG: hypothetical protein KatS3mg019_0919 [Fimbriimonadales bacterium]
MPRVAGSNPVSRSIQVQNSPLFNRPVSQTARHEPRLLPFLVKPYLAEVKATKHPRTHEAHETHLKRFLRWCEQSGVHALPDFGRSEWLAFLDWLRQQYNGWTPRQTARTVRAFLRWCVEEGYLSTSPVKSSDLPKPPEPQPKPLTVAEVRALMDACRQGQAAWLVQRNRALIGVAIDSGLRKQELLQMTVACVHTGVVQVRAKGGRVHATHLAPQAQKELRKYLRAYESAFGVSLEPEAPLWRDRYGEPLSANALRLVMQRLSKAVGKRVGCHRLRATSICLRLAQGASTELVRQAIGHRDDRSLRHYARLSSSDLQTLLAQTSPLNLLTRKGGGKS